MDPKILELRIQQWIPLIQAQADSGLSKKEWCNLNGIERTSFFRWQKRVRSYLLEQQNQDGLELPVLKQHKDDESFVELPSTHTALAGVRNEYCSESNGYSSIHIHYGGFSISLNGEVDERQLSSVLRVVSHVD
jgi:hypothetical protein